MDESFQDIIDEFLLREDKMRNEDIAKFHKELAVDEKKMEQFEFSYNLKKSLESRESKQKLLLEFGEQYELEKSKIQKKQIMKKIFVWTSSIAAVFAIGVFMIRPLFSNQQQNTPDASSVVNENYIFGADDLQNNDAEIDTTQTKSTITDSIIEQKSTEIDLSWDAIK